MNNAQNTATMTASNPIQAAVQAKSTKMLFSCMAVFEKKGSMNLDQDEFTVEGYMLAELADRGFEKWVDAYVEKM
jgi:hypothetical protein